METHCLLFQKIDQRWVCCINILWFIKHTRLTLMRSKVFLHICEAQIFRLQCGGKRYCQLNYTQSNSSGTDKFCEVATPKLVKYISQKTNTESHRFIYSRPFLTLKGCSHRKSVKVSVFDLLHFLSGNLSLHFYNQSEIISVDKLILNKTLRYLGPWDPWTL